MNSSNTQPDVLRIAMPRKGRIAEQLKPLCEEAGYSWPSNDGKALFAKLTKNVEVMFVRTTDIVGLVADEVVDLGVTGTDVVDESGLDVQTASPLPLFECKLVLAAGEKFEQEYKQSKPKSIRVATSFPLLSKKWAKENGIEIKIIPLSGSVEIAPKLGIADAIIDLTQTGTTMKTNGLSVLEEILDVQACIIAPRSFDMQASNPLSFEARNFCEALSSVLEARGKRYMMMNVPKGTLEKVKEIVPGLDSPTVLDLYGNTDVVAVHVVIEASKLNDVIPQLRDLGVHGILVSHIERLIP